MSGPRPSRLVPIGRCSASLITGPGAGSEVHGKDQTPSYVCLLQKFLRFGVL